MEVTNKRIEKEIQKAKAEIIVRQELLTVQFNTTMYKKVVSFIITTIFFGAFWTWCSSSETSNYAIYIKTHKWTKIFFVFLPTILDIFWLSSIVISAINIKKKIDFEYWMSEIKWKKLYQKFILHKVDFPMAENDIIKNLNKAKKMLLEYDDIRFDKIDFENYLRDFYERFKVDLSVEFYSYLAEIILVSGELEGTLIKDNNDYIFIVKNNQEFLNIVTLNV